MDGVGGVGGRAGWWEGGREGEGRGRTGHVPTGPVCFGGLHWLLLGVGVVAGVCVDGAGEGGGEGQDEEEGGGLHGCGCDCGWD